MLGKINKITIKYILNNDFSFLEACSTYTVYTDSLGVKTSVATSAIPLELFFLHENPCIHTLYKSYPSVQGAFNVEVYSCNLFNLHLRYSLSHYGYSLVDMFCVKLTGSTLLCYNWVSITNDTRLMICTNLPLGGVYVNTAQIASASWLEREVAEFSSIRFLNAKDTRRLLTDYLFKKNVANVGNTQFYNFYSDFNEVIS